MFLDCGIQLHCLNKNRGLGFLSGRIGSKVTICTGFAYCTMITGSMGMVQLLAYFTKLLSKSTRYLLCFYSFYYGFGNYDLN